LTFDSRASILLSKDKVSGMVVSRTDLLQGTLDLLILKSLAAGPMHGWAVSKRIRQISSEVLTVNQGSLYPALYRLEDRGWIASTAAESLEGRPIRLYRLTPSGRRQLSGEIEAWRAFSAAVNRVVAAE
jgi:transcriptional regulator